MRIVGEGLPDDIMGIMKGGEMIVSDALDIGAQIDVFLYFLDNLSTISDKS
ncbi:hypothetical protein [Parasporobacterium paucivorans]|uniref:Uncharacterized protein n=1 Tax=Parasporobacterium paucivorans DSM 15970 TaxID=1122934 RepID=A0A1M6B7M3_9FIRM|nr:hypothetical protein [Parasporobacterium paucivorans]SHI44722.1 hypothetical protein SAMN02745691_00281 [Parasporobacterium paucivorans DSM 15970]